MAEKFWYRALMWILRRRATVWSLCANRHTTISKFGPLEVTVIVRDTREANGYSREELYKMLRTIRENERVQEWKVPEPEVCS